MSGKKSFLRFVEIAYLFVAAIFLVETVVAVQNDEPRWWLSLLLSLVAIGMYFFKRYFRKKTDKRKKQ